MGDDFLDEKSMESDLKDSMESYYNDLDEDDAIEELLRYNVIEETAVWYRRKCLYHAAVFVIL